MHVAVFKYKFPILYHIGNSFHTLYWTASRQLKSRCWHGKLCKIKANLLGRARKKVYTVRNCFAVLRLPHSNFSNFKKVKTLHVIFHITWFGFIDWSKMVLLQLCSCLSNAFLMFMFRRIYSAGGMSKCCICTNTCIYIPSSQHTVI